MPIPRNRREHFLHHQCGSFAERTCTAINHQHETISKGVEMNMKNKILLILILTLAILVGCDAGSENQMRDEYFFSIEDVSSFYFQNQELINYIKDGFFSSEFIPHDGIVEGRFNSNVEQSIFLKFDYENSLLFCCSDYQCEKFKSIQNIHSSAVEYFMLINRNFNPSIAFRKIRNIGIVVEFNFFNESTGIHTGLIYTIHPELWSDIHLEGNWHVYRHGLG